MTQKTKPWNKNNPKPKNKRTKMTPAQVKSARARAKKAGRPYPNLVDNMAVKKQSKARKTS